MRDVRLVAFDLDGTLIDASLDIASAVNATLARVAPGTPALSDDQVRAFIGDGALRLLEKAFAATGIDLPAAPVVPVFVEAYRAHLVDRTFLYPGVEEALAGLRGLHLAVLTNKPGELSRAILEALGIAPHFAQVVGGGDVPTKKPDPEGMKLLLARAGVPPHQAMLVGDSGVDIATGRAAGVVTVGVTFGFDAPGMRAAGPDRVIDDLRDLPRLLHPRPQPGTTVLT